MEFVSGFIFVYTNITLRYYNILFYLNVTGNLQDTLYKLKIVMTNQTIT